MSKAYKYAEKEYFYQITLIGVFTALLCVYCAAVSLMQMQVSLFTLGALVAGYSAWNVFGARANPRQVLLAAAGLSFVSYGKSEKFLFDEIDQFRAKDFRGNGKIYVRVRAGKHHGRYWLHTFHYNDGEELFIYILKLEYKTHPTSLKAMAWDSTRPGEDKTPVLPWLLVHNKERG